jgi:methionyl-tRNA formyltransferase
MHYAIFTIKEWNISVLSRAIKEFPGEWHLFTHKDDLTLESLSSINPRYVFFPHWSWMVDKKITDRYECVCFHETDLPYGRGGSPLQNLIVRGHRKTIVSAIKMNNELDAGGVYLKKELSLEGLAEEIYIRSAHVVAKMMYQIVTENPSPVPQEGVPEYFERRVPKQSELSVDSDSLYAVFDHLRMLDADSYPRAYIEFGNIRVEFSRPALRCDKVVCDATITIKEVNK